MPASRRSRAPRRRRASLTRRGKLIAAGATVVVAASGSLGYFALFPQQAPAFVRHTLASVGMDIRPDVEPPPPACPLSGELGPHGEVPERPPLAIKVENAPEARPQAALNAADVVVEEPVEGGYTRFIAIFHCRDAGRVGPVRSGRTTDPDYLRQLGPAVFGYAGGVARVKREVPAVGLVDVNYLIAADAYTRDPSRSAPHNLYTSTRDLWEAASASAWTPVPLFAYTPSWDGPARQVGGVHLPFSGVSDVVWTWDRERRVWLRSHGDERHVLEDGEQVFARSVVIQVVRVTDSDIVDAAGNPSPDVELTGSGRAFVLRGGKAIVGRWERPTLDDVTRLVTRAGEPITLAPGRAWVELVPSWVAIDLLRP